MGTKALVTAGWTMLLLVSAACGGGRSAGGGGASDTAATAPDTARLRAVYGQIDSTYDSLMARYGSVASRLSPEGRQLYQAMQQMHGRAVAIRGTMMGGGGAMGGRGMMGGGGMMQGGARGGMGPGALREWDQQMLGMHQALGSMLQQAGDSGMATMHQRIAGLYGEALQSESHVASTVPPKGESLDGSDVYAQNCAACHGGYGRGVPGVFPPLARSEWVAAKASTPIRIVLYGLEGHMQVGERSFNGVMPAFGARLTDQELAAVLSYIRSAWGNGAAAVEPSSIAEVRRADAGRVRVMSPDDLRH